MGTINSSNSKDVTNNNKKINSLEENSEYEFKTIEWDQNSTDKSSSRYETKETTKSKLTDIDDNKIPFKFEWKEGGKEVKLAGEFLDNWNKHEKMKKNNNTGIFEITLNLSKGVHQFKFIVDKHWLCSRYYNINYDNMQYANNIIDLSNSTIENNQYIKKSKKDSKETLEYGCNYPISSESNYEASNMPIYFGPQFNINCQSNQDYLEIIFKKCLFLNQSKNILENDSFKSITTYSHDKVLHLCINNEDNYNDNNNISFIRSSITQRNKHKFITLIYYSPKK